MKLLELFKELTLHPKNAEELKGLILQLAVQGKLTSKWRDEHPDVETATVLLERVKIEKAQLVKEKKIKKENSTPKITRDETPNPLPETWTWCRLGEISEKLGAGSTPSGGRSAYLEEGVMFFRSQNIHNYYLKLKQVAFISDKTHEKMRGTKVQAKDLLLNITGGSIGRCALVPDDFTTANVSQHVAIVRMIDLGFREYIHSLIVSPIFQKTIMDVQVGVSREGLSMTKLKVFLVPLPPLEEQKAIVKVVNQLFKEVEQLETLTKDRIQLKEDFVVSAVQRLSNGDTAKEWGFLQEHFKTFFTEKSSVKKLREAVLQLAVQGKLTTKWRLANPNTEPAIALLKRIKAEKEQLLLDGKIKKEKPLPMIKDDEIPFKVPDGWEWCRLQELCPNITSGTTPPKGMMTEGGVPFLKVYNIQNQQIDFKDRVQFVNKEFHLAKMARTIIRPHDVLMNIVGPPLAKVAIVPSDFPESNCNQNICLFRPVFRSLNKWIYTYLCEKNFLNQIKLVGSTGQDFMSGMKCKMIMLPLPPIEEQKAIVEKVNALMALCDTLEQEITKTDTQVQDLMKSCLREGLVGDPPLARPDIGEGTPTAPLDLTIVETSHRLT